jgi:hypothetical protein
MHVQITDLVRFRGKDYSLIAYKGRLPEPADFGIRVHSPSTVCYRGFISEYRVRAGRLLLTSMRVFCLDHPPINGVLPIQGTYHDLDLELSFTGRLCLATGITGGSGPFSGARPCAEWDMVYLEGRHFREVLDLEIRDGVAAEVWDRSSEMAEERRLYRE